MMTDNNIIKYKVEDFTYQKELLGSGGNGEVLLCVHKEHNTVAVKCIRTHGANDSSGTEK